VSTTALGFGNNSCALNFFEQAAHGLFDRLTFANIDLKQFYHPFLVVLELLQDSKHRHFTQSQVDFCDYFKEALKKSFPRGKFGLFT